MQPIDPVNMKWGGEKHFSGAKHKLDRYIGTKREMWKKRKSTISDKQIYTSIFFLGKCNGICINERRVSLRAYTCTYFFPLFLLPNKSIIFSHDMMGFLLHFLIRYELYVIVLVLRARSQKGQAKNLSSINQAIMVNRTNEPSIPAYYSYENGYPNNASS